MRTMFAALGAATILVLAGCGDSSSRPEDGQPVTPSPSAPSPTPATATVSQWASLVAPYARDWQDTVDGVEEDCLDPATIFACHAGYLILKAQAQTVLVVLNAAMDSPDYADYLGEPPAEIERLVARTIEAAENVVPAIEEYAATGCGDPLADSCRAEGFRMGMAVDELTSAYDAWGPYL